MSARTTRTDSCWQVRERGYYCTELQYYSKVTGAQLTPHSQLHYVTVCIHYKVRIQLTISDILTFLLCHIQMKMRWLVSLLMFLPYSLPDNSANTTGNVSPLQSPSQVSHTNSSTGGETGGLISATNCSCTTKDERSLTVGGSLGWAAGTAILIFAFSNTVIVAATLVITYILYHVLITSVGVLAPGMAALMAKFLAVFSL